jgi:hypothetical protein
MINKNKSSSKYEYSIFTCEVFNKPNMYTLCYRDIPKPKKWYHSLFSPICFSSVWTSLSQCGTSAYGYKTPFVTQSIEEINEFMDWNIEKDNKENIKSINSVNY